VLSGRAAGLSEEKLAHLADDPLPEGLYAPAEAAIVRYAQASTRNDAITDALYGDLAEHYAVAEMIQICFVVGIAGMLNRFNSTFLTDLDPETQEAIGPACPVPLPPLPGKA
jgi:alkylhydroperoxidase family enzyme